jgi:aarF domain-containing kinase
LNQLLEVGFFHCDPHPGNLMKMDDTSKGRICILDYGLMAEIPEKERKFMVAAIIHVGNKNFAALTEDYIELGFLPPDIDKSIVTPISERVLGPIIYNGGGANGIRELANDKANFQQVTQDLLKAQSEIPFSIPPFIATIARAIAILEGLALSVDPKYKIVMEAYPFVTRKLLKDSAQDTQQLLREVMYDSKGRIQPQRFTVLMNSALNIVNRNTNSFIDLNTPPENGAGLDQIIKFIISDNAGSIKKTLINECVEAGDLVLRESARRTFATV